MGNSLSIRASIAVEALACSGRLLPVVHPTIPARINAPAAMVAKLVLRICSLLRMVRTYDRSPTGLEYQADVARHRFRIVCIGRADQCRGHELACGDAVTPASGVEAAVDCKGDSGIIFMSHTLKEIQIDTFIVMSAKTLSRRVSGRSRGMR